MKQIKPLIIIFMIAGVVACTSTKKSTSVDSKDIKTEPSALTAELKQGQDLFVGKCGKCHDLPVLASHDTEGWKKVMDVMGPKAKLDAAQTDLVYRYITNK